MGLDLAQRARNIGPHFCELAVTSATSQRMEPGEDHTLLRGNRSASGASEWSAQVPRTLTSLHNQQPDLSRVYTTSKTDIERLLTHIF